jgi:hypothetical protein
VGFWAAMGSTGCILALAVVLLIGFKIIDRRRSVAAHLP